MKALVPALVLSLALSVPALAQSTARASADLPVRSGPGSGYTVIGTLPKGAQVPLVRCTRDAGWCLIDAGGTPGGWVRGSYLVGMPAKVEASPPEFLVPFPRLPLSFMAD